MEHPLRYASFSTIYILIKKITLELVTALYRQYKKPNDSLYTHTGSDHPPNILKQLPNSICGRPSRNSANEIIFDANISDYVEALKKCGHPERLTLSDEALSGENIRRAKCSSPNEKFVTFARRKISPNKNKTVFS